MQKAALALIILGLMSSAAPAQWRPASRPAEARQRWAMPGMPGMAPEVLTEEERAQMARFMEEYSPHRWQAVQSMEGAGRRGLMRFVMGRWRMLQRLQEDDPQKYQQVVRRVRLEDEIFGLAGGTQSAAEREAKRTEIQQKVTELMELDLRERQQRIARLEKMLQEAQEKLAADERNREQTVERRVDQIVRDGPMPLHDQMRGMRRGPEGPGGPPPEGPEDPHASEHDRDGPDTPPPPPPPPADRQ